MKKIVLLVFSLFVYEVLFAQNFNKKWAIGCGPGLTYNMEKENLGFLGGLYLSRYLSPTFDLRLKGEGGLSGDYFDFFNPSIDFRLKLSNGKLLPERSAFQPYLYGGAGYLFDNLKDNGDNPNYGMSFNTGVGTKFPISSNTSLFLEVGYINGIDAYRHDKGALIDVKDNFLKVSGIIEFSFGSGRDSDRDGVRDRKDKCLGTPPGVEVDKDGCPLDTDGDGVPDYKDDCPDEPGKVKFNGCPDKDDDGIPDKDDICPDIPGLKKFNGCPDSDGDGIPDNKDECLDTPRGCPVDENGCPLDSDGDGIIDFEDKCPTEPGVTSNDGCPDIQELEIPAIYFDFDKANLKTKAKLELDKLIKTLSSCRKYSVVVGGHTCDIGAKEYNMKLSERRANAVVKYLLTKGVNNAFVSSNYYGENKPAVPNNSVKNRRLNRRVEFEEATIKK